MAKLKGEKFNFYNIIWYFLIFSIAGLIIETIYCYATTCMLESRKGLIWGPFCPVYGIGASLLIIFLNRYKDNYIKLFISGFFVGSIIEYLLSFMLEAIYGIRFWEYSYINNNLNGRVCIPYSIFWGILSILLINFFKPLIDKLIDKLPENFNKKFIFSIFVFFVIDALCTVWAISACKNRISDNLEVKERNYFEQTFKNIENSLFPTEYVIKTFPNLRIIENGQEKYIRDLI